MIGPQQHHVPPSESAQIVAVLLEAAGGQLIRFKLAKAVTIRAGRVGEITVSIIGDSAFLSVRE